MLILLSPLLVLNVVFGVLLGLRILPTFTYLVVMVNTIGAMGDLFMAGYLLKQRSGIWVQDTKTGIDIWANSGQNDTFEAP
jgi:hypothetical protein